MNSLHPVTYVIVCSEVETNVSMKVEETDSANAFKVSGRGGVHLAVLIETMRREGYELQVKKPRVIFKTINDKLCEPLESIDYRRTSRIHGYCNGKSWST